MVAYLMSATARCPAANGDLRCLVAVLCGASTRLAGLGEAHAVGVHETNTKTIGQSDVGPLTLECGVITFSGADLRIVAWTAALGSDAQARPTLHTVVGTQDIAEPTA